MRYVALSFLAFLIGGCIAWGYWNYVKIPEGKTLPPQDENEVIKVYGNSTGS